MFAAIKQMLLHKRNGEKAKYMSSPLSNGVEKC
jgi:hypothetical protein